MAAAWVSWIASSAIAIGMILLASAPFAARSDCPTPTCSPGSSCAGPAYCTGPEVVALLAVGLVLVAVGAVGILWLRRS